MNSRSKLTYLGHLNPLKYVCLYRYLGSRRGGEKKESQQKELATDLSKFLRHSNSTELNFHDVVRMKAVNDYVDELERWKIGPSGIISKLNTLCHAQTFLIDQ